MGSGELVCGLLEREETPPSMQALGSEMIDRRRSAPEQKSIQPGQVTKL